MLVDLVSTTPTPVSGMTPPLARNTTSPVLLDLSRQVYPFKSAFELVYSLPISHEEFSLNCGPF